MKRSAISLLFIFLYHVGFAQADSLREYYTDSVMIQKIYYDRDGKNLLSIKVINPCGLKGPYDGAVTIIDAHLKSNYFSGEVKYNHPDAQAGLIYLNKKDILIKDIDKGKAVFIPFFYCGNWDSEMKVSYIIFFNRKKYLYHINFHCDESFNCKLHDDLNTKLKELPSGIKVFFIKYLKNRYKKASDFYKN